MQLLCKLAKALRSLHEEAGLSHNALNPGNVMLSEELEITFSGLTSVGPLTRPYHPYLSASSTLPIRFLYYTLPLKLFPACSVDMWGFGMIMFELFSIEPLFEGVPIS